MSTVVALKPVYLLLFFFREEEVEVEGTDLCFTGAEEDVRPDDFLDDGDLSLVDRRSRSRSRSGSASLRMSTGGLSSRGRLWLVVPELDVIVLRGRRSSSSDVSSSGESSLRRLLEGRMGVEDGPLRDTRPEP